MYFIVIYPVDPSALQIVSIDESFKDHFNMGTMLYLFSYSSSYTGGYSHGSYSFKRSTM